MSQTKKASMMATIDQVLASINESYKQAGAYYEPGSQGGETTHPIKDVDDGTQAAVEGARFRENTEDVKKDHPVGVENATGGGTQDDAQTNIGLQSKATGEDPSNETNRVKDTKDDPGSSHPARTDNSEIGNGKYASSLEEIEALTKLAADLGNDITATITIELNEKTSVKKSAASPVASSAPAPAQVADAGYAAADADADFTQDKQALDNMIITSLAETILEAESLAEKTAQYLAGCFSELNKQAEGMIPGEEVPQEAGQEGAPPEEGGDGELGSEEAQLLQLLLQGQGGQGAEGGGLPPEAGLGGEGGMPMDPAAGGLPPEAGMGGDEGGDGDELAMLQQILAETGISPEELEAAVSADKQAKAAAARKVTKWIPKSAGDKKKYAAATAYLKELVSRSR